MVDSKRKFRTALVIGCALLLLKVTAVSSTEASLPVVETPKEFALKKLRVAGVSESMISLLEQVHNADERNRIVELNVLGFLGKADYSGHYSKRAVRKCTEFIRKYRRKLKRVESMYGVPKEVIASLLWVETKHGTLTGRHSVPDVYFSLVQSDHPEVMKATLAALSTRAPASVEEFKQKAIDRSYAKANWALRELKSLDEMRKTPGKDLKALSGSYAGAFGIPQFIPSSYLQWARPKAASRQPDLFNMEDAIQSVGFYLKANGWKRESKASQRDALYHYNRADGYVDVILKIADAVHDQVR